MFEASNVKVLSPKVVSKFFALKSDDVNGMIMTITHQATNLEGIYAFPYLEGDIIDHLSANFLLQVILDMNFVFNMSEDIHGLIYDRLYQKLDEAGENSILLAVNSFNLVGWMNMQNRTLEDRVVHTSLSNNFLSVAADLDAYFRKLYIHYTHETSEQVNFTLTQIRFNLAQHHN